MNKTFTFRQLEADPTLCAGMKRLWQDSEGKTVTYQVQEVEKPRTSELETISLGSVPMDKGTEFKIGDHLTISSDGMFKVVKPKPKARGKKK